MTAMIYHTSHAGEMDLTSQLLWASHVDVTAAALFQSWSCFTRLNYRS
jgi:hypothetical protein